MPGEIEYIRQGVDSFRRTFLSADGKVVLAHLRAFCFADLTRKDGTPTTLFDSDPLKMAAKVGRWDVYQEILRFVQVPDVEIDQTVLTLRRLREGE